ncbi:DUF1348 family protein [Zobellia laminariae]|uniref:DUF1348 family protein n=1 Tax=Zobellia laminariae TaxID=248906 RepID=UPI003EF69144
MDNKLLLPPFNLDTAKQKIQFIEDIWNRKDPTEVSNIYSIDCEWYTNESISLSSRQEVQKLLEDKWKKQLDFEVTKKYLAHTDNSIALKFNYDYRMEDEQWYCSYGNEILEFNESGLVEKSIIRIYHSIIKDSERPISPSLHEFL